MRKQPGNQSKIKLQIILPCGTPDGFKGWFKCYTPAHLVLFSVEHCLDPIQDPSYRSGHQPHLELQDTTIVQSMNRGTNQVLF